MLLPVALLLSVGPASSCGERGAGAPSTPAQQADALVASLREQVAMPRGPWAGVGTTFSQRAVFADRERALLAAWRSASSTAVARDLGVLYTQVEEHERGLAWLLRAQAERPDDWDLWLWLGLSRLDTGDLDQAELLLANAERLQTERPEASAAPASGAPSAWLGVARSRRGDADGARAAFERALAVEPDSAEAALGLAELLADEGRGGEALPHLERLLERDPEDPGALWLAARICEQRGETDRAAEFRGRHARATLLDDLDLRGGELSDAQRRLALAEHLMGSGREADAVAELRAVLAGPEASTFAEPALTSLTLALLRLGRLDEARAALARLERAGGGPDLARVLDEARARGIR